MTKVLVFGAVSDGELAGASLEAVSAAHAIGAETISGALIGTDCKNAAARFAPSGLASLAIVDDTRLAPYCAELHVAAAKAVIEGIQPDLVIVTQTPDTAEWLPLLAGALGAALATNATKLASEDGELIVTRPVCGGAVSAEYTFNRALRLVSLAPGAFAPVQLGAPAPVTHIAMPEVMARVQVLDEQVETAGVGPQLRKAKAVVSGGLGIGSREHWRLVEETASALGAAVGATRAVVELGWVPSSQQVGFSGQKISPDLYIAVGISGAVHHLAGLAGAKTIVAINKDPEAGIFRAARFGAVGDAKEIVPAFAARVRELRAGQG
jgi:electron transfer flavoprotein alpha subunit